MQIKDLSGLSVHTLAECLNLAFSDYIIPLYVSAAQLGQKIIRERIVPSWSVGLFDGNRLVGFILHGQGKYLEKDALYNAGTGILPPYRGHGYTMAMYHHLLPKMQGANISSVLLEVIDQNERALKVYQKLGFKTVRAVDCLKGKIHSPKKIIHPNGFLLEEITKPQWELLAQCFDYSPTWQNDLPALLNGRSQNTIFQARKDNKVAGYLIFSPRTFRIHSLGVLPVYRRQGIATALLNTLPPGQWSIINIDQQNNSLLSFLQQQGWEKTIGQLEMVWHLS